MGLMARFEHPPQVLGTPKCASHTPFFLPAIYIALGPPRVYNTLILLVLQSKIYILLVVV